MTRNAYRPARAIALASLLVMGPLAAAANAGHVYKATTVDKLENGKERSRIQVDGWVEGDAAKVVITGQKGTMFKDGSYLLTEDGGRTLYLVDPKEKAYAKWDLEAMLASIAALFESMGPLLDLDFTNATSQKLGEEDGG